MKSTKITILLLMLFFSSLLYAYISVEYFDDYNFPKITIDFLTDFEINWNQLLIFEEMNSYIPYDYDQKVLKKRNALDVVFFIDTSFLNQPYKQKIIEELLMFKNTVIDNHYDCSFRIITSSDYMNQYILDKHRNLFLLGSKELDEIIETLFFYGGVSSGQFDIFMDYVDSFEKKEDARLLFVYITNGREIGQKEIDNYRNYMLNILESKPEVFVFTDRSFFNSEFFYDSLAEDTNGYLFDIKNSSFKALFDLYFDKQLFKNRIIFKSSKAEIREEYAFSLYFTDRKEMYDFNIKVPFYDELKINAIIADPFIAKKGQKVLLECISTPMKYVQFAWNSLYGELIGQYDDNELQNNQIYWIAPEEIGNYNIYLECKYRNLFKFASITIKVE